MMNLKKLDNVTLYLTIENAKQLRSYLNQLIENPKMHHAHLSSEDYQKEVTVCLYDASHLENFDDRSKKLILSDE